MNRELSMSENPNACGFVLGACGQFHLEQAIRTCQEIQILHPGIPVDLYTDSEGPAILGDDHPFDQVCIIRHHWFRPKLDALVSTRFDKTIYLDNDIFVLAPIDDVFQALDRFDIAICHNPNRIGWMATTQLDVRFPNAMPQLNAGMLGFRKTAQTTSFMTEWRDQVLTRKLPKDQPVLREMLYQSDLHIGILPDEYNLLFSGKAFLRGKFSWPTYSAPRIYHFHPMGPDNPVDRLLFALGPGNYRRLGQKLMDDPNIANDQIRPELLQAMKKGWLAIEWPYVMEWWPFRIKRALRNKVKKLTNSKSD